MNIDRQARKMAAIIKNEYAGHKVGIKIIGYEIVNNAQGIVYNLRLKRGTQERLVTERAGDIQSRLGLPLFQVYKEGGELNLVVSGKPFAENSLWKILCSNVFRKSRMGIPLAVGYTVRGDMYLTDLAKLHHLLIAGSSGWGKSAALQCLILSILAKQPVKNVNLLLFDTGARSLEVFQDIPHLSHPIVADAETGIKVIRALSSEMERRKGLSVDDLEVLPLVVCVIDEFVSFISNVDDKASSKLLTDSISDILRRGRHTKIHMVLATQDPKLQNMKVDLGNITARMAFKCAKPQNSVTILGEGGAEDLLVRGAMLFKEPDRPDSTRLQGAFMKPEGIKVLVQQLNARPQDEGNKFEIDPDELQQCDTWVNEGSSITTSRSNKELAHIILWVLVNEKVSTSRLKKAFPMGNRADDIMEKLRLIGIVTEKFSNQPRKVIPQSVDEVPADVMEFLAQNGVTAADVAEAIANRC